MKDLEEHFVSGELVYDGALLKVRCDRVRLPDGGEATREYIRHPGAVAIVPLFEDGTVLLERQFRYPHRRTFIEVPAGKLDPGEPPEQCARRELQEETGYRAGRIVRTGEILTAPGFTDERIHLFCAYDLIAGAAAPEPNENLELHEVTLERALEMIAGGEIVDAKSIVGLFHAARAVGRLR